MRIQPALMVLLLFWMGEGLSFAAPDQQTAVKDTPTTADSKQVIMTRVARLGMGGPYDPRYPVVACRGHLLAWGKGPRLEVYDATPPGPPRLLGQTTLAERIPSIVFVNDRLCAIRLTSVIQLVDLSDPTAPRLCANVPPLVGSQALAGSGNMLGMVNDIQFPRFQLLDVTDPDHPVELGGLDLGAKFLAFAGHLALLSYGNTTLRVIDTVQPSQPVLRATLTIGEHSDMLNDMVTSGTTLYAAMSSGLHILDFSQADNPVLKGVWKWNAEPQATLPAYSVFRIALAGNRACVVQRASFGILSLDDPSTVTLLGSLNVPFDARQALAFTDGTAYATSASAGVLEIDAGDPRAPRLSGGVYLPGGARGVAVENDVAWLANGKGGLMSIDISDPVNPRGVRLLPYEGQFPAIYSPPNDWFFDDLTIRNGLAYCAATRGISVIDVSDPVNPRHVGLWRYLSPWDVPNSRISVDGRYAALSATSTLTLWCPLRVMDIQDPANPTLIGMYWSDVTGVPDAVVVAPYVYFIDWNIMNGDTHLRIMELKDGAAPIPRGSLPLVGRCLAVEWPYVYVDAGGVTVCDVSNPDAPVVCGNVQLPDGAKTDMFIQSHMLFVACGYNGVRLFDLTDPRYPRPCGAYIMERVNQFDKPYVNGLYVDDQYLYLAAADHGLELVRYRLPASACDWQNYE